MLKYRDQVKITKDDHEGFYIGAEGIILNKVSHTSLRDYLVLGKATIYYEVWLVDKAIYCTEDYLQKIDKK